MDRIEVVGAAFLLLTALSILWAGNKWFVVVAGGAGLIAILTTLAPFPTLGAVALAVVWSAALTWWYRKEDGRAWKWLAFAAFFAALIGGISNSAGSLGNFPELVQAWFHVSHHQALAIVVALRKTAHFTAYGVAALAVHQWGKAVGFQGLWRGLAFAVLLSSFDEFRQTMSASREGSVRDVLLDVAGALTFVGAAWLISRYRDGSTTT